MKKYKTSLILLLAFISLSIALPTAAEKMSDFSSPQMISDGLGSPQLNRYQGAGKGSLSGKVTSEADGSPLFDISVNLYRFDGENWPWAYSAHTDTEGQYKLNSIDSGMYKLRFQIPHPYDYYGEIYNDALNLDSATVVEVFSGLETSGIDVELTAYGQIKGRVVADEDDLPLDGITVEAKDFEHGRWGFGASASTDENGYFTIRTLEPGTYRVGFEDRNKRYYLDEFFDDVSNVEDASDIQVENNQVITGINAALDSYGWISGKVTRDEDGQPVDNMVIQALYFNGFNWKSASYGKTDSTGHYKLGGMETGTYRVFFKGVSKGFANEYYDNVSDVEDGIDIEVTIGDTVTGIDASMARLGRITGRVTAEKDGEPLQYIYVLAKRITANGLRWGAPDETDENGYFEFNNLISGSFVVSIEHTGSPKKYVSEYYDNKPDAESATVIHVNNGSVTNLDVQLSEYGHIIGTVTAEIDGRNLPAEVCVYRYVDSQWKSNRCESTRRFGFDIDRLQPGNKRLKISSPGYYSEFYDNVSNISEAVDIPVDIGKTVENINVELKAIGAISGKVTDEVSGLPLKNISVEAIYPWNAKWWITEETLTDANGNYKIENLPTNELYYVSFKDLGNHYQNEFYDNVSNFEDAIDIEVNEIEVKNINATLTPYPGGQNFSVFQPLILN